MLSNRIRRLKPISTAKKICRDSKSWFCSRQKEVLAGAVPGARLGRVRLRPPTAGSSNHSCLATGPRRDPSTVSAAFVDSGASHRV